MNGETHDEVTTPCGHRLDSVDDPSITGRCVWIYTIITILIIITIVVVVAVVVIIDGEANEAKYVYCYDDQYYVYCYYE